MRIHWILSLGLSLLAGSAHAITCKPAIPETTPTAAFTFAADGSTVIDNRTGLEWKRCLEGQTYFDTGVVGVYTDDRCIGTPTADTWQGALAQAASASAAGWRLPNVAELGSIVEDSCYSPAANLDLFPDMGNYYLWASSPVANDADHAWILSFNDGADLSYLTNNSFQVRLVR